MRRGRMGWAGAGLQLRHSQGLRGQAPGPGPSAPLHQTTTSWGHRFLSRHYGSLTTCRGPCWARLRDPSPCHLCPPPSGTCACGTGGVIDRPVLQGKSPNDTEGREGRVRRRHVQTQGFYRNWFYRVVLFSLGSRSRRCRPTRPSRRRVLTPRTSERDFISHKGLCRSSRVRPGPESHGKRPYRRGEHTESRGHVATEAEAAATRPPAQGRLGPLKVGGGGKEPPLGPLAGAGPRASPLSPGASP